MSFGDSSGYLKQLSQTAFDPWGVVLNGIGQTNSIQNRFEMQGKESEKTFGLNRINFGARTMNPTTGVFDRVDMLANLDFQLSPYAYVGNNPLMFIDPTGMKRVDIDGSKNYYDDETGELTIVGQKPKSDPLLGNMFINYAQNYERTGNASPAGKYFREGGSAAAAIVAAPLLAIGAAEMGLGALVSQGASYLTRARMLSSGRWMVRNALNLEFSWKSMLTKASINLTGKMTENLFKGEMKLDLAGLGSDIFLTNGISAAVGGVGEAGYNFQTGKFYRELNGFDNGSVKFATGFGLGRIADKFGVISAVNGLSSGIQGLGQGIIKFYEEAVNAAADKIHDQNEKRN